MLMVEKKCPWCGREIAKPKFDRGTCEHCRNVYESFVFTYERSRFTGKVRWRGEMSLPVSYLVRLLIVAFFGWNALRVLRHSHGMSLLQAVMALAFVYLMFIQPTHVYLKKVEGKEGGGQPVLEEECIRRAVFLSGEPVYSYYNTRMEMEILDPGDASSLGRKDAVFHLAENLDVIMEIPPDYPEYFQRPGMPFKLYDRNGTCVNHGITQELYSENPDLFQVQLSLSGQDGKLDKKSFYLACVPVVSAEGDMEGGGIGSSRDAAHRNGPSVENKLLYAIVDSYDGMESLKTGDAVYEMMLYHCREIQKTMLLPAAIRLYREDGKFVGGGTVTYYYSKRYVFENKRK